MKPSVIGVFESRQQLGESDELYEVQDRRVDRKIRRRGRDRSISPLAGHAERTAGGALEDEAVDARDAALLQDRKPATAEWMKRVRDLSRSRRLVGTMCSSRWVWECLTAGTARAASSG